MQVVLGVGVRARPKLPTNISPPTLTARRRNVPTVQQIGVHVGCHASPYDAQSLCRIQVVLYYSNHQFRLSITSVNVSSLSMMSDMPGTSLTTKSASSARVASTRYCASQENAPSCAGFWNGTVSVAS